MITTDRLDELETLMPDTPADARISIPARDLRDLVALIPVVRAAWVWCGEARMVMPCDWHKSTDIGPLYEATLVLRAKGSFG